MDINTKAIVEAIGESMIENRDSLADISEKLNRILSELSKIESSITHLMHVVGNKG